MRRYTHYLAGQRRFQRRKTCCINRIWNMMQCAVLQKTALPRLKQVGLARQDKIYTFFSIGALFHIKTFLHQPSRTRGYLRTCITSFAYRLSYNIAQLMGYADSQWTAHGDKVYYKTSHSKVGARSPDRVDCQKGESLYPPSISTLTDGPFPGSTIHLIKW